MDRNGLLKLRIVIGSVFALAAAGAFAGKVTLFDGPAFQGRSVATTDAVPNLRSTSLSEGVSSVMVSDGTWEACTEAYFRGRCAQLVPGNYGALSRDLNGPVASVRQVGDSPSVARFVVTPDQPPVAASQAPLTINPGAAPVVINAGQAPVVINSGAAPVVVNPGTQQVAVATPVVTTARPQLGRVVLYQHPNFGGPTAIVEHGRAPDLDWANFRYPATSLRVESGSWLACSDVGYQGDCLVFGMGDYPMRVGLLSQGVYSVRQVS